jgi:hypothetical protein
MVDGLDCYLGRVMDTTISSIPSGGASTRGQMEPADHDTLAAEAQEVQAILFPDFSQDKGRQTLCRPTLSAERPTDRDSQKPRFSVVLTRKHDATPRSSKEFGWTLARS